MIGVIVNAVAIIIGGLIGTFAGNKLPDRVTDGVRKVMGIFSLMVGIQGAIKGEKSLLVLISLVLGTMIGEIIDIDNYIERFGIFLKKKVVSEGDVKNARFTDAFVSASALMGIGAMAVLGSIDAGLRHNYDILFLKSMMDGVSAIVFASTMGIGIAFASITVFVLQGSMVFLASFIKPIAENASMMNEIMCCGSMMIVAVGINILGIMKIKVANMLPAIIFVPLLFQLNVF